MQYIPRTYQKESIEAHDCFFREKKQYNAVTVLPTGSGKSVVIAETVKRLGEPTLILQPQKEILEQNIAKYRSYGYDASIYSASFKSKIVTDVTYATIGSIINQKDLFKHFKYLIIDECHFVNSKGGMYDEFIRGIGETKVLGLTATPYRLSSNSFGSMLKFITRTRPRIFSEVLYNVNPKDLFDAGYLCPLTYYDIGKFDRSKIKSNSSGADFDEKSLAAYMEATNFGPRLLEVVKRLNEIRSSVLVFTRFVKEAKMVADSFPDYGLVTALTPDKERTKLITQWREGELKGLANVGVLKTGVDYPALETVVDASPTKSLAQYYQKLGRAIRIHPDKKDSWAVDMADNQSFFGKIEDLHLGKDVKGLWQVTTNGRPLTNVILQ